METGGFTRAGSLMERALLGEEETAGSCRLYASVGSGSIHCWVGRWSFRETLERMPESGPDHLGETLP